MKRRRSPGDRDDPERHRAAKLRRLSVPSSASDFVSSVRSLHPELRFGDVKERLESSRLDVTVAISSSDVVEAISGWLHARIGHVIDLPDFSVLDDDGSVFAFNKFLPVRRSTGQFRFVYTRQYHVLLTSTFYCDSEPESIPISLLRTVLCPEVLNDKQARRYLVLKGPKGVGKSVFCVFLLYLCLINDRRVFYLDMHPDLARGCSKENVRRLAVQSYRVWVADHPQHPAVSVSVPPRGSSLSSQAGPQSSSSVEAEKESEGGELDLLTRFARMMADPSVIPIIDGVVDPGLFVDVFPNHMLFLSGTAKLSSRVITNIDSRYSRAVEPQVLFPWRPGDARSLFAAVNLTACCLPDDVVASLGEEEIRYLTGFVPVHLEALSRSIRKAGGDLDRALRLYRAELGLMVTKMLMKERVGIEEGRLEPIDKALKQLLLSAAFRESVSEGEVDALMSVAFSLVFRSNGVFRFVCGLAQELVRQALIREVGLRCKFVDEIHNRSMAGVELERLLVVRYGSAVEMLPYYVPDWVALLLKTEAAAGTSGIVDEEDEAEEQSDAGVLRWDRLLAFPTPCRVAEMWIEGDRVCTNARCRPNQVMVFWANARGSSFPCFDFVIVFRGSSPESDRIVFVQATLKTFHGHCVSGHGFLGELGKFMGVMRAFNQIDILRSPQRSDSQIGVSPESLMVKGLEAVYHHRQDQSISVVLHRIPDENHWQWDVKLGTQSLGCVAFCYMGVEDKMNGRRPEAALSGLRDFPLRDVVVVDKAHCQSHLGIPYSAQQQHRVHDVFLPIHRQ